MRTHVLEVNTEKCRLVEYFTDASTGRKRLLEILEGDYLPLMSLLETNEWSVAETIDCRGQNWEN